MLNQPNQFIKVIPAALNALKNLFKLNRGYIEYFYEIQGEETLDMLSNNLNPVVI